MTQIKVRKLTQ